MTATEGVFTATTDGVLVEVSVVMPCLNEAETLETCIVKALKALRDNGIAGEVVIADNGSTDGSQDIATRLGARVVAVEEKGYGNALMGGIAAARGKYIVMADADDSYEFSHVPRFLEKLRQGYDLVMGNRFAGGIKPGAMPFLHRYLGNPVLTFIGKLFFWSDCGDFHCGMRGFSKAGYEKMGLRTTGMEFASEMVVKASLMGLRVAEVPTTLSPDGRSRPPHLHTWRDGWRHLRFLLLYSPRWLFFYPGAALVVAGTLVSAWILPGPRQVGGVVFDINTLVYSVMAVLVGYQAMAFAVFAKIFAVTQGLLPEDPRIDKLFRYVTLETGLTAGGLLTVAGIVAGVYTVLAWNRQHFGPLDPERMVRVVALSGGLIVLGTQIVWSSFFLSILGLKRRG